MFQNDNEQAGNDAGSGSGGKPADGVRSPKDRCVRKAIYSKCLLIIEGIFFISSRGRIKGVARHKNAAPNAAADSSSSNSSNNNTGDDSFFR